jgi:hypothetical protein
MRHRLRAVVAASLCVLCLPNLASAQSQQTANTLKLDEGAPRPKATLADIGLLVGHWQGPFLGATAEEIWLPVAGGSMLGVYRLYQEGKVVLYEIMTATEEEGSVSMKIKHFHPDLKGWEEKDQSVTFRFIKASADTIWFEGLTFRKQRDGSLQGFIALSENDGRVKEESFLYRPVAAR